jgi:GT2 family glycosyltransferase
VSETVVTDRFRVSLPAREAPDVTVIIVNYNTGHLFGRMFASLEASREGRSCQVVVVDNASRDDSVEILRRDYPSVELIENSVNVGFGRANNQALSLARGRYILLLNTDAFVSPDTLRKTISFMDAHPRCGVLGVTHRADGSLQPSCRYSQLRGIYS